MPTLNELEQRAFNELRRRERRYEREVQGVLRDVLNDMRAQMTVMYDRHARDGKLSLADMTRYNRLRNLEEQFIKELDAATRKTMRTMNTLRPEQYGESFFRYAWAVDQATGVRLQWGQLNRDAIVEALDNRFYKIAVQDYPRDARSQILRAINSGLPQGKSYTRMSRDLKKAINTTFYRATRIIRTEGQTAINAGQMDSYIKARERGVEVVDIWDATLDGATRPAHQSADGQQRGEDGFFIVGGEQAHYPADPMLSAGQRISCRCRLRGEIEGYAPAIRRSREDGVIPYQKYEDWERDRGKPRWR